MTSEDYRPRGDRWLDDDHALAAWRAGIPIVDAGMRQLLAEGWMHDRAGMIVASLPPPPRRRRRQQHPEWHW